MIRRPAASFLLGLVGLAACSSPAAPPTWPRGSTDVVLQVSSPAGVPPLGPAAALPDLTVYGDGLAVGGGRVPTTFHLDDHDVGELLVGAAQLDRDAAPPEGPDAPVVAVTWATDGGARSVRVPGSDDAVAALLRQAQEAASGATSYSPAAVAVLATSGAGGPRSPWPLGRLDGGTSVDGSWCTVLTGGDARRALRLRTSPATAWTSRGVAYAVAVRPLLPHERDCADLP